MGALCAENLYMGKPNKSRQRFTSENHSEEELKKKWSELRNKEDWDDECENCERPIMLHIGPCKPRKTVIGDNEYRNICREWRWFKEIMNSIMKKDNEEENFETNDDIDEKNKGEIEEIENEVGAKIQIIRPHAPIDGDKNGENYETDEIDEKNEVEMEEIENELGAKI